MTRPHAYCLGTLVLDRILEVDHLPGPDDKVFVRTKREAAGGPARNIAAALAEWGDSVSLGSVLGDDAVGMRLLGLLDDCSIGSEAIEIVPDLETAATVILVGANGERCIAIDPVPDAILEAIGRNLAYDANDAVIANLFHRSAAADAFERAAASGAAALLDLEWPELERWGWDAALATARQAGIVSTNGQVMRAFAEREGLEPGLEAAWALATALRPAGGKVCVTLGASGVVARSDERRLVIPALPVQPRNTTGAGDRFLAGLAHALLGGASFETGLAQAVAAAGLFLRGEPHDWTDIEAAALRLRPHAADRPP